MAEHKLINGTTVSDDDFERWAAEWENDTWEGPLTDIRIGKPPISGEELGSVTFKASKSRIAAMEARAESQGMSKSQFMRMALEQALA